MGKITRAISRDGGVVMSFIDSTDIVRRAEQIHTTSATVTAALGRTLTAASLMGYGLKGDETSLTLRIKGDGPVGSIVAVSDPLGNVRGSVGNPIVELPLNSAGHLDVGGAVGHTGTLYVIKDLGMRDPYIGSVPLTSGEIAEDVTAYYAYSEQIPTVCALGVLVNPDLTVQVAGGYLIQLLPGATDAEISQLEENIKGIDSVTNMMRDGMSAQQIIDTALKGFEPELLDTAPVEYRCNCTRERVSKMLVSLGKDELSDMIAEGKDQEICCHFCEKKYVFTCDDLKKILKECTENKKSN